MDGPDRCHLPRYNTRVVVRTRLDRRPYRTSLTRSEGLWTRLGVDGRRRRRKSEFTKTEIFNLSPHPRAEVGSHSTQVLL